MPQSLPSVLIPGLLCSARLYAEQIPALWPFGSVTVADHRRDSSVERIAARLLASAPAQFAIVGLSMGGYIVLEVLRQAPERVAKVALLDTGSRADDDARRAVRDNQVDLARNGRMSEVFDALWQVWVHPSRYADTELKRAVRAMSDETGVDAFARQQVALKSRPDARPGLGAICCPTMVLVGDSDQATPPDLSREIVAGIPGSRLVVVPECGHLSTMERPDAVNRALVEWMES